MKNKKKKSIDDMSVEELLEELRKSQGPRDALIEISSSKVRITKGKKKR